MVGPIFLLRTFNLNAGGVDINWEPLFYYPCQNCVGLVLLKAC